MTIVRLGRQLRADNNLKVRQPLSAIHVVSGDAEAQYQLERGRLRTVLSDAVWAAYRRCQQLGGAADFDANSRSLK